MQLAGATPGACGSWQTPTKLRGNIVQTRWISVLHISRPARIRRRIRLVMRHAGGARREDGEVGAALLLDAELALLDARADLVVADARRRRHLRRIALRRDLRLAPGLVLWRRRRVMAVAVDDHGMRSATASGFISAGFISDGATQGLRSRPRTIGSKVASGSLRYSGSNETSSYLAQNSTVRS